MVFVLLFVDLALYFRFLTTTSMDAHHGFGLNVLLILPCTSGFDNYCCGCAPWFWSYCLSDLAPYFSFLITTPVAEHQGFDLIVY